MTTYEYAVIPAPTRGDKAKGAKTATDRYALTLAAEMNRMAAEGWDYVRAEVLPSDERSGLTGRSTVYHNLLVFRRAQTALAVAEPARAVTRPQPEYPVTATPMMTPEPVPPLPEAAAPLPQDAEANAVPPAPRTPPIGP